MKFEFATAGRIIFGPGTVASLPKIVVETGKRLLIVHGSGKANPNRIVERLNDLPLTVSSYSFVGEPSVEAVRTGVEIAVETECDLVIGYGGGSVIDMAKAIAGLRTNLGDVTDYLEVIGGGRPLVNPALPVIAIPTTAGTGSEVTRNAVISSIEHRVKVSLRSPTLLPKVALVDPELTYSLPPAITASTGMDALTQLIEPFVSTRANPMTDGFCLQGIPRAAKSLRVVYYDPNNQAAREDLSLASLLGGLALANSGLGGAHGFAGSIGGMFTSPHGQICARMLAPVSAKNIRLLRERDKSGETLERYRKVAILVTGNPDAQAEDFVNWVEQLVEELRIPTLREMGVRHDQIPAIVGMAQKSSSMKANPVLLSQEDLEEILLGAKV